VIPGEPDVGAVVAVAEPAAPGAVSCGAGGGALEEEGVPAGGAEVATAAVEVEEAAGAALLGEVGALVGALLVLEPLAAVAVLAGAAADVGTVDGDDWLAAGLEDGAAVWAAASGMLAGRKRLRTMASVVLHAKTRDRRVLPIACRVILA
jgi:hypothetical protein